VDSPASALAEAVAARQRLESLGVALKAKAAEIYWIAPDRAAQSRPAAPDRALSPAPRRCAFTSKRHFYFARNRTPLPYECRISNLPALSQL